MTDHEHPDTAEIAFEWQCERCGSTLGGGEIAIEEDAPHALSPPRCDDCRDKHDRLNRNARRRRRRRFVEPQKTAKLTLKRTIP